MVGFTDRLSPRCCGAWNVHLCTGLAASSNDCVVINDGRSIGWAKWPAGNPTCWRCGELEFDLRLDNKSRMSREIHVRFRESLGVRFPRATRLLLGFVGTREEAEDIKSRLASFLREQLRLELSPEKTLITHARSEKARFLGYELCVTQDDRKHTNGRRSVNAVVSLRVPKDVIKAKCEPYQKSGRPIHRPELLGHSVFDIVAQYQSVYRGIVNFYRMAHNLRDLSRLHGVMQHSLTKTLAAKLRISVPKVYERFATTIETEDGQRRVLEIRIDRRDKKPLIARWGDISLAWQLDTTLSDREPVPMINMTELVQRLAADECELCGSRDNVQVHHIRALKNLQKAGRPEKPLWARVMAARRRKSLVVCETCHWAIHEGRPTRTRNGLPNTGEPDDLKGSRPVRGGVVGKGPTSCK